MKKGGQPRPKLQHFIPRMHLQHFVGDSPKNMVWTFDSHQEKWRPSLVSKTGAQTNFYSVATEAGSHNDELELALSEIETAAAPVYQELLNGIIPTGERRAAFSMFLATLYLRTPAMINAAARITAEMAQLQLAQTLQSEEAFASLSKRMKNDGVTPPKDRLKLIEFLNDNSRYSMKISQKRGLGALLGADELAPLLYYRSWYVAEAVDATFITSDHPVHRFVPREDRYRHYGDGGFKNARAEISFPLSPKRMLLIYGQDEKSSLRGPHLTLPSNLVAELNRMRAAAANQYLYAAHRDENAAAIAVKHREDLAGFSIGHPGSRPKVNIGR